MKKNYSRKATAAAVLTGATALMAFSPQSHAQSSDALIDKLVDKGILTVKEAQDLRDEADKDFRTAFSARTGMPDWVTGYKISGDVRARMDHLSGDNNAFIDRLRLRYRVRFGITVNMLDNLEAGLRLGSGDSAGNQLSNNSTAENDFSKKPIWVDAAYGRWTPINSGGWLLAATVGKMDNPFIFTPMIFDNDLTPEGGALQGSYMINDKHTLAFNGGVFVLDEEGKSGGAPGTASASSTHDPIMYGGQVLWNAKWSLKWASTLGVGAFQIVSPEQLSAVNVPINNQGNTRLGNGLLANNYNPIIGDASVTYALDSFPFYTGAFPIRLAGEVMHNPAAKKDNNGYWVGVTFGKSGTRRTWDLTYRYEYLEADAWFDQLVEDDNGAFYQNTPTGAGGTGYVGSTNIKGHMVKFNYSFTDSFTFSFTCYMNDLINQTVYSGVTEPNSSAIHVMADVMWKF